MDGGTHAYIGANMTPNQLTTYLEYLNKIDRSIGVSKKAAYEAIDEFRTYLIGHVENTTGSAADVWAAAQLQSVLGTADPAHAEPGTGMWNFGVNQQLTKAQQRMLQHDRIEDNEE